MTALRVASRLRLGNLRNFLVALGLAVGLVFESGCGGSTPLPALAKIQITPADSVIPLRGVRQLIATGVFSDGSKRDMTMQVTWSSTSAPNPTDYVTVDPTGLATAQQLGTSVINASFGSVVGVTQLTVSTTGLASSTMAFLPVPFEGVQVDAAYFPQSQTPNPQGLYTVEEINLDADQFSTILPVPAAVIASIPMPVGYVPNAAAASSTSFRVVVISYSSPDVQIIDASNDPTDLASNTVVSTFTAPVHLSAAFNGVNCIVCGVVINPVGDQALLSTAQGYFTLDLTAGTFTPLPLVPTAFPAPSFVVNPADPNAVLVYSPTYGQDPNASGEVQILNLTSNTVTTNTALGTATPGAIALDQFNSIAAVADINSPNLVLLNMNELQNPTPTTWAASETVVPLTAGCAMPPAPLSMNASVVGIGSQQLNHVILYGQASGSCVGLLRLPAGAVSGPPDLGAFLYGFGAMPPAPDGNPFLTGSDVNAISAYVSIYNRKMYGLLVNADQTWIARLDLGSLINALSVNPPDGTDISSMLLAGQGGDPIVYLPTSGDLLPEQP